MQTDLNTPPAPSPGEDEIRAIAARHQHREGPL